MYPVLVGLRLRGWRHHISAPPSDVANHSYRGCMFNVQSMYVGPGVDVHVIVLVMFVYVIVLCCVFPLCCSKFTVRCVLWLLCMCVCVCVKVFVKVWV